MISGAPSSGPKITGPQQCAKAFNLGRKAQDRPGFAMEGSPELPLLAIKFPMGGTGVEHVCSHLLIKL